MILRNVEVGGRPGLDVRLQDGRIAEIGPRLAASDDELDGAGGALIPGLADHHIHLMALAAQADSIDLQSARSGSDVAARIREASAARPAGAWIRAVGYHEAVAGELGRRQLDAWAPGHPLRVQHQTGALWILNSAAIAALAGEPWPECVELDARAEPTGRVWRGDAWLRRRIGAPAPALAATGERLASYGITALTDASVTTDAAGAARLAEAVRTGELPQRLTLMSRGPLSAPADGAFAAGPRKVLLDDHDLPPIDEFVRWVAEARADHRRVAVHCVTAAELALTLAAFEAAGAFYGDRIEHGGVIPKAAIPQIRALGLTVVTQSIFICERGERYAAEVPEAEQPDLYRCATLQAAHVPVAGSSDAPYGSPDPWAAIRTAIERRTAAGRPIGLDERVRPETALQLYLGDAADPGGPPRKVVRGAPADLCLLKTSLRDALADPSADHVAATFVAGRRVWPR